MNPDPLILIIEDDTQVLRYLRTTLGAHNFRVLEAHTAKEGFVHISTTAPDIVLLDLGLPDMDGVDVIKEIRTWSKIPIIILSARGLEDDKVLALDAGADDYLAKPFGLNELLARIRVSLRHSIQRQSAKEEPVIKIKDLSIDLVSRQITLRNETLHLTPIEYKLLTFLATNAGKVVTHRTLLRETWGPSHQGEIQYLRSYMAQLRKKIEGNSTNSEYFLTEPGVWLPHDFRMIIEFLRGSKLHSKTSSPIFTI